MKLAYVLSGKIESENGYEEVYQLAIDDFRITRSFNEIDDRLGLYNEISDFFVYFLTQVPGDKRIKVTSGSIWDADINDFIEISALERELIRLFSGIFVAKIKQAIPISTELQLN